MNPAFRLTAGQGLATLLVSLAAIHFAGGTMSALALQVAAALVGALAALAIGLWGGAPGAIGARVILVLVFAVEAYVLLAGVSMEGVRRWISLGPVQLHPASLLAPLAAWAVARRLEPITAGLIAGVMLVLAAQPDAAAVLALTLGVAAGAFGGVSKRGPVVLTILGLACAAYAFTRHDPLPAVAHVERVIPSAFAAAPLVGLLAGLSMAALPLAMLWRRRSPETLALAGVWAGFILANLLGNYPAPVIGAGASPLLGWLLSIGLAGTKPREP